MRGSSALALVVWVTIGACAGEPVTEPPPPGPAASSVSSPPPEPSAVAPPPQAQLPLGLPSSFPRDLEPAEVPSRALVPPGSRVTGVWFARTSAGDALVVAWADPRGDPFRQAGGVAAWRRYDDSPPWRAVFGRTTRARDGVLGVRATTADVTGDGSEDAIVVQDVGGTGACGRYTVLDLMPAVPVWERELCDGRVDPSIEPIGLAIDQAVYEPGDPHCCPSAFRRTVLVYDGSRWARASMEETPAGG